MFVEKNPKEYHSAIVDVTDKCNLRCKHCFYFREERDSRDMEGRVFLDGLKELRDRHNILSMGWCGGEPLYRREIVEEGIGLFKYNTIYTNGTLPLAGVSNAMVAVSIDGPPEIHDYIRGKGTFEKTIENVKAAKFPGIVFLSTIHKQNAPYLRKMVSILAKVPNTMFGFLFFTPLKEYRKVKGYSHTEEQMTNLDLSFEERDRVIEELLELKKEYGAFFFNPTRSLELMMSETAKPITQRCNMTSRTLTLDLRLERKLPCVLGTEVDCSKCGCIFPFVSEAQREGDKESLALQF